MRPRGPPALRQNCPCSKSQASAPIASRLHEPGPTQITSARQSATERDMSSRKMISSAGRPLSPGAIALMLMLCFTWGFNQIAIKLVLPDIPPMLPAAIRSAGALPVLLLIGQLRGAKLFRRDGTLVAGLVAGVMFGLEFVLIHQGLPLTSASRAVVFLFTAPFFVALGSYQVLGERLRRSPLVGLAVGVAGAA